MPFRHSQRRRRFAHPSLRDADHQHRSRRYRALVPSSLDEFVFPRPWRDLRGDAPEVSAERSRLTQAFRASFGTDNRVLRTAEAIAVLEPSGEVLARASDGSFLLGEVGWDPRQDHYRRFPYAPDWDAARTLIEERAAG